MKTVDGKMIVIAGSSRCGKTTYTAKRLAVEKRVAAWDVEDQWAQLRGWTKVTTRQQLWKALQNPAALKIAYVAGGDLAKEFDYFCRAVFYAGRFVAPLTVVLEELADVTNPQKAPAHYGILLRRGLKRGINMYCISQRWAEADKTAFGNASEYVLFLQSSADDEKYMSRKTRVSQDQIAALKPFEYIHYERATQKITAGKVTF